MNRCDLRPGDYESFYTNGDIIFEQGVQRITEDTPIAEIGSQGGIIVQGEAQQFYTVDQTISDMNSTTSTGASLIGDGTTAQENNLPMNELRVKMAVQAKKWYFLRSSLALLSLFLRSSFALPSLFLRSSFACCPFVVRSLSVRCSFVVRSIIEQRTHINCTSFALQSNMNRGISLGVVFIHSALSLSL